MGFTYEGKKVWMYIGEMYLYKNQEQAENQFKSNQEIIDNARANNWDLYNEIHYPTNIDELKKYYQFLLDDGVKYSKKAIIESDAKISKEEFIKNNTPVIESGEEENLVKDIIQPEKESLGSNEMIVAVVAIVGVVLILIATMITIIVLVNRKRN